MTSHLGSHGTNDMKPEMLPGVQTGNGIKHVESWLCACARIQKRQHLKAKTTIVKLYICMNSCPQNKIDPPPKKNQIHKKKMPMPELHTAPALSRLCGIVTKSLKNIEYVKISKKLRTF